MILAGAVFAALMAPPLFAQSPGSEGAPRSRAYLAQKKQLRIDYRGLDEFARKSSQPTSNPDPIKQGPCRTAPGFCPDYHGGNGG
jgi:hypothetical protein